MCCRFAPDLFGPPDGLERLAKGKVLPGYRLTFTRLQQASVFLFLTFRIERASVAVSSRRFRLNNLIDDFVLAVWGPTNLTNTVL